MDLFQDNLKDLIVESGKSLRQLEKEMGVSSSQLSRYLKGTIPSLAVLNKIANFFDCSIDFLVGIIEEKEHYSNVAYDANKFLKNYNKYLKENNTTHWKFAKENNFNEAVIRHWKNGETPKTATLITIAVAMGITIEELMKWVIKCPPRGIFCVEFGNYI